MVEVNCQHPPLTCWPQICHSNCELLSSCTSNNKVTCCKLRPGRLPDFPGKIEDVDDLAINEINQTNLI